MLLPSDRHTERDLALWRELEAADRVRGRSARLARLVERSLEAIREFLEGGLCAVATSWGKDSVVTLHLVRQVDPTLPVTHLRVLGSRDPHRDDVRDAWLTSYPDTDYHEVELTYTDLRRSSMTREEWDRLTDERWYAAIDETSRIVGTPRRILGIRADESKVRRMRCMRWGHSTRETCAPLAWWRVHDVFAYAATHDLPLHPSYGMLGGGRWKREHVRVAEIGDTHGTARGRREWEREYYPDVLARLESIAR